MKLESMIQGLRTLGRDDLLTLQAAVGARLAELAGDLEVEPKRSDEYSAGDSASAKAGGSIELKMIGGCGPYAYLRYWEGGHLRSKYLGKADKVVATKL
jgi:hypothetical protein